MGKWTVGGNKLPLTAESNKEIAKVASEYGLTAYEIAGGRNLVFTNSSISEILSTMKKHNISLSIHAQYGTSVLSAPSFQPDQLVKYVGNAVNYAYGFKSPAVLHVGGKDQHDECQTSDVITRLHWLFAQGYDLADHLYLETMDGTFYGTFPQLWKVSQETGTRVCVDWTHLWAKMSHASVPFTKRGVKEILRQLETADWKDEMYFHMGGASISSKGEAEHQLLSESSFPWKMVLDEILASSLSGRIIVESGYHFMNDARFINDYISIS